MITGPSGINIYILKKSWDTESFENAEKYLQSHPTAIYTFGITTAAAKFKSSSFC